jgi:uncharacterized protein (TIGR02118 family)
MIKVSVLYPYTPSADFDYDYYLNKHMALVSDRLGASLLSYSVEKGLSAGEPGTPPLYVTQCHLFFDSLEALNAGMGSHGEELSADVPNFTTITPVTQVSEVLVDTAASV